MIKRPLYLYPLFQIPLILFTIFILTALLSGLLGWGRPRVAVAVALDLSNSTYQNSSFNAPGTILNQEVQAVEAYLQVNTQQLSNPNQIKIFGFGGAVKPLTRAFVANGDEALDELRQALRQPDLPQAVQPNQTDVDRALRYGLEALQDVSDHCRELLLVTDGTASVSPDVVSEAILQKTRLNSVVVGNNSDALQQAALLSNGIYLSDDVSRLTNLFTDQFFVHFNSNLKWIIFWLGCAWVALMWALALPLDRWFFQGFLKMTFDWSGRLALGNALFWTFATPGIIWRLAGGIPLLSQC